MKICAQSDLSHRAAICVYDDARNVRGATVSLRTVSYQPFAVRALASAELRAAVAIHFCTATACAPAIALSRSANSALAVTHS